MIENFKIFKNLLFSLSSEKVLLHHDFFACLYVIFFAMCSGQGNYGTHYLDCTIKVLTIVFVIMHLPQKSLIPIFIAVILKILVLVDLATLLVTMVTTSVV